MQANWRPIESSSLDVTKPIARVKSGEIIIPSHPLSMSGYHVLVHAMVIYRWLATCFSTCQSASAQVMIMDDTTIIRV